MCIVENSNDFQEKKHAILVGLYGSDALQLNCHEDKKHISFRFDKSLKKSVDTPLQEFVDVINFDSRFVTTSCCSGRICAFLEHPSGKKNQGKLLYCNHGLIPLSQTCFQNYDMGWQEFCEDIVSSKFQSDEEFLKCHHYYNSLLFENKKTEVADGIIQHCFDIIFKNMHEKGSDTVYFDRQEQQKTISNEFLLQSTVKNANKVFTESEKGVLNTSPEREGVVWLNVEPFVIHIQCCDLESANLLLEKATLAGLKNSGLMLLKKHITVALRGSQRLHTPILEFYYDNASNSKQLCFKTLIDKSCMATLLCFSNKRLIKNWHQVLKCFKGFLPVLQISKENVSILERRINILKTFILESHNNKTKNFTEEQSADDNALLSHLSLQQQYRKNSSNLWMIVCNQKDVKPMKIYLENCNIYDRHRKIMKLSECDLSCIKPSNITSVVAITETVNEKPLEQYLIPIFRKLITDDLQQNTTIKTEQIKRISHENVQNDNFLASHQQKNNSKDSDNNNLRHDDDCPDSMMPQTISTYLLKHNDEIKYVTYDPPVLSENSKTVVLHQQNPLEKKLASIVNRYIEKISQTKHYASNKSNVINTIPNKWERFGSDLVLFPSNAFLDFQNQDHATFWEEVALAMNCKTVGVLGPVVGEKRQSQSQLMFGSSGVVYHKENGVTYAFDVTKCMFASGNGTERSRLPNLINNQYHNKHSELIDPCILPTGPINSQSLNLRGTIPEVFVDMYCGIGYFTLPVLVHCSSNIIGEVWACDWNETALYFLKHGVQKNLKKIIHPERLTVLYGDSRLLGLPQGADQGKLQDRAHRISLGLIPTSEEGWDAAFRLANPNGCMLHIHGIAKKKAGEVFAEKVCSFFKNKLLGHNGKTFVVHVERVKSYKPTMYHFVVDLWLKKS